MESYTLSQFWSKVPPQTLQLQVLLAYGCEMFLGVWGCVPFCIRILKFFHDIFSKMTRQVNNFCAIPNWSVRRGNKKLRCWNLIIIAAPPSPPPTHTLSIHLLILQNGNRGNRTKRNKANYTDYLQFIPHSVRIVKTLIRLATSPACMRHTGKHADQYTAMKAIMPNHVTQEPVSIMPPTFLFTTIEKKLENRTREKRKWKALCMINRMAIVRWLKKSESVNLLPNFVVGICTDIYFSLKQHLKRNGICL